MSPVSCFDRLPEPLSERRVKPNMLNYSLKLRDMQSENMKKIKLIFLKKNTFPSCLLTYSFSSFPPCAYC